MSRIACANKDYDKNTDAKERIVACWISWTKNQVMNHEFRFLEHEMLIKLILYNPNEVKLFDTWFYS